MARPWDAEVDVTPALAASLVDGQWPDLAPARVVPLALGWDNAAFLVNEGWVLRLPRRSLGARCMEAELRWLPAVAAALPVPVSVSTRVGRPTGNYPYAFGAYRRIEGETACSVAVDDAAPGELGSVLRVLHGLPADASAPSDEIRRADMARGMRRVEAPSARLRDRGVDLGTALPKMEALAGTAPWAGPRVWLHGDLYARHVVVDARGHLAGLIDWGDIHAGDPALDLSIAFSLFRGTARDRLLEAYGRTDPDTLDRARFRALHYGVVLLDYGLETGDRGLERAGALALENGLG